MNPQPVPARVVTVQELRRSNAAQPYQVRRPWEARGGRQGAKQAAIAESLGYRR